MKKIDKNKIKTWLVTGASSGVGYSLCNKLLDKGYNVVAIARHTPVIEYPNVLTLPADVTNVQDIKTVICRAIERFGHIDVLCNNAGVSSFVTIEEETDEHAKSVMNVNYWGAYNTIHELLPYFRKQKYGTIINNTSMHGLSLRFGGGIYCASKYALEGLNSVCWHETQKFCRVMAFELGAFNTDILLHSKVQQSNIEEYKNVPDYYKKFDRITYINDLDIAIDTLINQVELDELPRRLIIGKDAYHKINIEIGSIKKDLKYAKKHSLKCSVFRKDLPLKIIKKIIKCMLGDKSAKN